MAFLAGMGLFLGGIGGAAAFLIVRLVALISNLALLHRVGFSLPDLSSYQPSIMLFPVALGGAAVVILLSLWSPVIKGHGIPESLEAISLRESRVRPRAALAKPLSAAIAMGTGGPFGAEGPIIVTGGSLGSLVGQFLPVTPQERRILLSTGAAAGMAGVFATPIAAIVLAFELLLFERSLRALLPLMLATGLATEIHYLLLGSGPLFKVIGRYSVSPEAIPMFGVVGLAAGLLAVLLNKGLFAFEAAYRRLPIPELLHPLLGAVGFAGIGLVAPGSLSVGYWAIAGAVNGRFVLGTAAILFVTKMVSWWVSLASNTSGGTLAPMFLIGATMGEMIGIGFANLFPGAHVDPGAFALVAMGATFGVGARALFTGGLFALEVTGAYQMAVPMLIAIGVAELVAELFLDERIMTDKLVRRGVRVHFDTESDPFKTRVARQVMTGLPGGGVQSSCPKIDQHSFVSEALTYFVKDDAEYVVVTDDGAPVGIITLNVIYEMIAARLDESCIQPPTISKTLRSKAIVKDESGASVDINLKECDERHPPNRTH